LLSSLVACQSNKNDGLENRETVARVFDEKLYLSDLRGIASNLNQNIKDSAAITQQFIEQWIEDKLFYKYAKDNLEEKNLNIEKQIEDYRKALIIYKYQSELIKQKMDTNFTLVEMSEYYLKNEAAFKLKDHIIKGRYLKVNLNTEGADKVVNLFKSRKREDSLELENYCAKQAFSYFLDPQKWILFEDLKHEIPINTENVEAFLKNSKFTTFKDSTYLYVLNINDYKLKNTTSPLSFELDNVRKILINKRKLDLIDKVKKEVVSNARENKEFEIYQPK
jgi:hypothetical protein